jgi:methylated-DNA-[protein]-cysteine S-methyltransferase
VSTVEIACAESPLGPLLLAAEDGALVALSFAESAGEVRGWCERHLGPSTFVSAANPAGAVRALERYWSGRLDALSEVPVRLRGTGFQVRVWETLRRIPSGATWSYATLARAVGAPTAMRAVGAANGQNPVAIIVPCHRVIGSDGNLTGYGGGIPRKAWLLCHEGVLEPELPLETKAADEARPVPS